MSGIVFSFHSLHLRAHFITKAKDSVYVHSSQVILHWLAMQLPFSARFLLERNNIDLINCSHTLILSTFATLFLRSLSISGCRVISPGPFSYNMLYSQKSLDQGKEAVTLQDLVRKRRIILMGKDNTLQFRNSNFPMVVLEPFPS